MSLTLRHVYKFDSFIVDVDERVLLRDGRMLPMTPKVFETLFLLVRNQGSIVTKEKMLTTLWPDVFVEESNVTFNIRMLRKALGDTKQSSLYIETIPRRGYRFKTQVREVVEEDGGVEIARPEVAPHSGNGNLEAGRRNGDGTPTLERSDPLTLPQTTVAASITNQWSLSLISRKRFVTLLAAAGLLMGGATIWRFNRHSSASAEKSRQNAISRMPLAPVALKIDQVTTYGNVM